MIKKIAINPTLSHELQLLTSAVKMLLPEELHAATSFFWEIIFRAENRLIARQQIETPHGPLFMMASLKQANDDPSLYILEGFSFDQSFLPVKKRYKELKTPSGRIIQLSPIQILCLQTERDALYSVPEIERDPHRELREYVFADNDDDVDFDIDFLDQFFNDSDEDEENDSEDESCLRGGEAIRFVNKFFEELERLLVHRLKVMEMNKLELQDTAHTMIALEHGKLLIKHHRNPNYRPFQSIPEINRINIFRSAMDVLDYI